MVQGQLAAAASRVMLCCAFESYPSAPLLEIACYLSVRRGLGSVRLSLYDLSISVAQNHMCEICKRNLSKAFHLLCDVS